MANIITVHDKKLGKVWLGVFIGVLTLVIVGAGVYLLLHKQQPATSQDAQDTAKLAASQATFKQANAAVNSGDYGKGQQVLDNALKTTATDTDKSNLYLQKSSLASNSKDAKPGEAEQYALKAEALQPTYLTAQVLATLYENAGNKTAALKYYKLVIQRMPEQQKELAPDNFKYFQDKVAQLSKS